MDSSQYLSCEADTSLSVWGFCWPTLMPAHTFAMLLDQLREKVVSTCSYYIQGMALGSCSGEKKRLVFKVMRDCLTSDRSKWPTVVWYTACRRSLHVSLKRNTGTIIFHSMLDNVSTVTYRATIKRIHRFDVFRSKHDSVRTSQKKHEAAVAKWAECVLGCGVFNVSAPVVNWDPSLHLNTHLSQRLNKGAR